MPVHQDAWSAFTTLSLCNARLVASATHSCSYRCLFSSYVGAKNNSCLIEAGSDARLLASNTWCSGFPDAQGYPLATQRG